VDAGLRRSFGMQPCNVSRISKEPLCFLPFLPPPGFVSIPCRSSTGLFRDKRTNAGLAPRPGQRSNREILGCTEPSALFGARLLGGKVPHYTEATCVLCILDIKQSSVEDVRGHTANVPIRKGCILVPTRVATTVSRMLGARRSRVTRWHEKEMWLNNNIQI